MKRKIMEKIKFDIKLLLIIALVVVPVVVIFLIHPYIPEGESGAWCVLYLLIGTIDGMLVNRLIR